MILIITTHSKKIKILENEFLEPIKKIVKKNNFNFKISHYTNLEKTNLSNFSKIIICGTCIKDDNYFKEIDKFDKLKNTSIPIFAICSGFQIISHLYNQKVKKLKTPMIDNFDLEKKSDDIILNNVELKKAYHINKYFTDFDNSFKVILKSRVMSFVKLKNKKVYLSLFHIEVNNEVLLENFLNLV